MDGIVNVLKPVGMTSTDVVRWMKRKTQTDKVGHIGTLDPGAAGVLPICLGKATRLAEYHSNASKAYRAEITLGVTTDTQDAFGTELTRLKPMISEREFHKALQSFIGQIEQIPPMYSAVRKDGKHLYELARKGIEVEREKRTVLISNLEMLQWDDDEYPRALFDIECSKGTYIRTLCYDIGEVLGCGAHMSFLLRLRAGCFSIENSFTLEEIEILLEHGTSEFLLDIAWGLELPIVELPPERLESFQNGLSTRRRLMTGKPVNDDIPVQVLCEGMFLGIGVWKNDCLSPTKVIK